MPVPADHDLWRRVAQTVRPLPRRTALLPPEPAEVPPAAVEPSEQPAKAGLSQSQAPTSRHGAAPSKVLPTPKAELTHGLAGDLDRRTLVRLRKGQMPVEGEIDLHGHTQEKAHRHLNQYLASAQMQGRRCVLVITGKGTRSEEAAGVLRTAVPRWLNEPANRDRVLAFAYATPAHGGQGAVYVLLRRLRNKP